LFSRSALDLYVRGWTRELTNIKTISLPLLTGVWFDLVV
jgi:hypothetical protein